MRHFILSSPISPTYSLSLSLYTRRSQLEGSATGGFVSVPKNLQEVQKHTYSILQEVIDNGITAGASDLPLNDAALQASCVVGYLLRATKEDGKILPTSLIVASMMIVTFARFTTTSSLLSWLLYSLVTYPGAQDRLLQELIDFNISNRTQWTSELANSLPFLDKFIEETQRLRNPSFQLGRTTKTEVMVPGGYCFSPSTPLHFTPFTKTLRSRRTR